MYFDDLFLFYFFQSEILILDATLGSNNVKHIIYIIRVLFKLDHFVVYFFFLFKYLSIFFCDTCIQII